MGIVTGKKRESCELLAVSAAGSHPLAPFVVGDKGGSDDEDSEDAEKNLHSVFRIARVGQGYFHDFAQGG
jgi:hypothetical protein